MNSVKTSSWTDLPVRRCKIAILRFVAYPVKRNDRVVTRHLRHDGLSFVVDTSGDRGSSIYTMLKVGIYIRPTTRPRRDSGNRALSYSLCRKSDPTSGENSHLEGNANNQAGRDACTGNYPIGAPSHPKKAGEPNGFLGSVPRCRHNLPRQAEGVNVALRSHPSRGDAFRGWLICSVTSCHGHRTRAASRDLPRPVAGRERFAGPSPGIEHQAGEHQAGSRCLRLGSPVGCRANTLSAGCWPGRPQPSPRPATGTG